MALNPVPQSNQTLGQTQNPILVNFSTLDTTFTVNHIPYNAAGPGAGRHSVVNFVNQMAVPTTVTSPQLNMTTIYAAAPTLGTGMSGLYMKQQAQDNTHDGIEFTAGLPASNGFAIIPVISSTTPNGIVLKWFSGATSNVGPRTSTIDVNSVGPAYTAVLNIQASVTGQSGDTNALYIQQEPNSGNAFMAILYRANNAPVRTYYLFTIGI
jgi:hypothetical protein